jgi:hypothetical protein
MKYNTVEFADCLVDAKEILQNLLYAQTKDEEFPIEDDFKEIANAKSLVTKAELLINPKSNKEQKQQLNKCDVLRLRALLEQQLTKAIKASTSPNNKIRHHGQAQKAAYENTLKLMDDILPVA